MFYIVFIAYLAYLIYPKYLDRQACANSVDQDQTPQSRELHCLLFVQIFYTYQKVVNLICSKFRTNMVKSQGVPIFRVNTVSTKWPFEKVACASSEDSDQSGHPPCLISLRYAVNG